LGSTFVSSLIFAMRRCSSSSVSPSFSLISLSASSSELRICRYTPLASVVGSILSSSASSCAPTEAPDWRTESSPSSQLRFFFSRALLPAVDRRGSSSEVLTPPEVKTLFFSQLGTSMSICALVSGLPGMITRRRSPLAAASRAAAAVISAASSPRSMPRRARWPLYSRATFANFVLVCLKHEEGA